MADTKITVLKDGPYKGEGPIDLFYDSVTVSDPKQVEREGVHAAAASSYCRCLRCSPLAPSWLACYGASL